MIIVGILCKAASFDDYELLVLNMDDWNRQVTIDHYSRFTSEIG